MINHIPVLAESKELRGRPGHDVSQTIVRCLNAFRDGVWFLARPFDVPLSLRLVRLFLIMALPRAGHSLRQLNRRESRSGGVALDEVS